MFRKLPKLVSKTPIFKQQKLSFHTSKFKFDEESGAKTLSKEEKELKRAQQVTNNIAVLVYGCGYLDGTDVLEACSTQVHLSAKNLTISYFTMDGNQEEVYDHLSKNIEKNEVRSIIGESTRITKNAPQTLKKAKGLSTFDFLVIPGGGGVLSCLTDYNDNGINFKINPDVEKLMKVFLDFKKPVILTSSAAILAAKMFGNTAKIAIGNNDGLEDECRALGANVVQVEKLSHTVIDEEHRIITTPGYTAGLIQPNQVFEAIGYCIEDAQMLIADNQKGGKKETDDSAINAEFKTYYDKETYEQYLKDVEENKKKVEAAKRKR